MTEYQDARIQAVAQVLLYNIRHPIALLEDWKPLARAILAAADTVPTPRDVLQAEFEAEHSPRSRAQPKPYEDPQGGME